MEEHESRFDPSCYTASRIPVSLVFHQCFDEPSKAIAFEKKVKGWSRAKKRALINGEFDALPKLSKNRQNGGRPSTGSG